MLGRRARLAGARVVAASWYEVPCSLCSFSEDFVDCLLLSLPSQVEQVDLRLMASALSLKVSLVMSDKLRIDLRVFFETRCWDPEIASFSAWWKSSRFNPASCMSSESFDYRAVGGLIVGFFCTSAATPRVYFLAQSLLKVCAKYPTDKLVNQRLPVFV